MKKLLLIVLAHFLFGCAQNLQVVRVDDVSPKQLESKQNFFFEIEDFIVDIPAGTIIEVRSGGLLCIPFQTFIIQPGADQGLTALSESKKFIKDELEKYQIKTTALNVGYKLKPIVTRQSINTCTPHNWNLQTMKGEFFISIKWQIVRVDDGFVLFDLDTEAFEESLEPIENGGRILFESVIKENVRKLVANEDFKSLITLDAAEKTPADKNYVAKGDLDNKELLPAASGSGFAISKDGYILTNNHVINGCQAIDVHVDGKLIPVKLIAKDPHNDLALIKGDFSPQTVFYLRSTSPKLTEEIYVAGYPFGYEYSTSIKTTKGVVSSLSGIGDNYSNMQIDAAVQVGNSGGPVVDLDGNVIGVVVSKLNTLKTLENTGSLPENTNFAIKSSVAKNFAESNGVPLVENNKYKNKERGQYIQNGTFYLSCMMTMARIKEMQTQKVFFQNITK